MIEVSQQDQIQILELNRPKVNAINESLIEALNCELDKIEKNDSIKGIILTGQDGIFCLRNQRSDQGDYASDHHYYQ